MAELDKSAHDKNKRTILAIIDRSEELTPTLRYACNRAKITNSRLSLLHVIEPSAEFGNYMMIDDIIREEDYREAEDLVHHYSGIIQDWHGETPTIYIKKGHKVDELIKLINEQNDISLLILGIGIGKQGPGPLVQALTGKHSGTIRIPITLVPGSLSIAEVDTFSDR